MNRTVPIERLRDVEGTDRGLTSAEVADRRNRYGANLIVEAPPRRWRELARDTATDPMIWFLAATSGLYAIVGDRVEALILIVAIVPLAAMDAFLHRRTQASLEGLEGRLAAHATVVRDGSPIEIRAADVVVGDLAVVAAGEPFPADGIVLGGDALQVDESILTGEAHPVRKHVLSALPAMVAEPDVEGRHWAFAGTRLLTGRAIVRVAYTGGETLYAEIVAAATRGGQSRTPLQGAIARLVSVLVAAASLMCAALAVTRLAQGYGWLDALVSAVTLASAALPEEFPIVFTFFLGVGAYRLARRQALVRRAVSVENIGRVSTICSDKTGTMTEGRLDLTHVLPAPKVSAAQLLSLALAASRPDANDPVDVAIAREAHIVDAREARAVDAGIPDYAVVTRFPFTEARRRESVIAREASGRHVLVTKGAAEDVVAMTALEAPERAAWTATIEELAAGGHKVIGCAWRPVEGERSAEVGDGFQLAGVLALEDPVRGGVAEAVQACRGAGIHVIMVTGDHPLTARAVARELGLGAGVPTVVTGDALDAGRRLAEGDVARRDIAGVDVIARATPAQKLALVRALQERGEVVAVTGDGVNDVPALQAADVGIAMGEHGTRSAREVASIVLLDDNFTTIVGAIAEGRQLFANLKTSFAYLLMVHVPLVLTAALIPLAGYPLLYLPVHVVWLEMIIHPTALLVFQELGTDRLAPLRATRRVRFFSSPEWLVVVAVGLLLTAFVGGGYVRSVADASPEHGRAMALAVLSLASAAITATLSGLRTMTARTVSAASVALAVVMIQTPALAHLVHVTTLHVDDWALAAAASVAAALVARLRFRA